jgi:hypothetical protein
MERTLSGNFQLTAVLTDKRQLVLTGYVYSDDTPHDINARLDAYQDALDRQAIRVDVMVTKTAELARAEAAVVELMAHNEALSKRQSAGKKLTSQQVQQMSHFDDQLRHWMRTKESVAAAIEEGKRKLNGAAK